VLVEVELVLGLREGVLAPPLLPGQEGVSLVELHLGWEALLEHVRVESVPVVLLADVQLLTIGPVASVTDMVHPAPRHRETEEKISKATMTSLTTMDDEALRQFLAILMGLLRTNDAPTNRHRTETDMPAIATVVPCRHSAVPLTIEGLLRHLNILLREADPTTEDALPHHLDHLERLTVGLKGTFTSQSHLTHTVPGGKFTLLLNFY